MGDHVRAFEPGRPSLHCTESPLENCFSNLPSEILEDLAAASRPDFVHVVNALEERLPFSHVYDDCIDVVEQQRAQRQTTTFAPRSDGDTLGGAVLGGAALGGLRRAAFDRTLFDDARVFANLLANEQRYMPSPHYFKTLQPDLKPFMRKMVTDWMLEVCEEQQCEDDVFALAVNYLDRFLSLVSVQKSHLQLVAAVAMFVASKLKESVPLTADKLVLYTDNSITYDQMMTWELLLLGRLRWDVAAITPLDFFDQILWRLEGIPKHLVGKVRRHAQHFASLTATDFKFIHYPPSMIAATCISAAISGLTRLAPELSMPQPRGFDAHWSHFQHFQHGFSFYFDAQFILDQLQRITDIDGECLQQCHEQVEQLVFAPTLDGDELHDDDKIGGHASRGADATTPTDVEAVAMLIATG